MDGVTERSERLPVELWRDDATERLVIRAYDECGCNFTDVDLWELMAWLSSGPGCGVVLDEGAHSDSPRRRA
jgi:hypothetical protein